jgi:pyruvate dehydrogenase (quinone)
MRTEDGNPVWATSQEVTSVDYAAWAELLGFRGIAVREDDAIGAALDEAFAHPGLTLIDAYVSKNVPPLPPHITYEFAKNTAKAFLKGDPYAAGAIKDTAKAMVTEGVERVKDTLHIGSHGDRDDDDGGGGKEE